MATLSPFGQRSHAAKARRYVTPDASGTGLLSAIGGEVTCERHGPYRGSDSWKHEQWRAVTWAEYFEAYATLPDLAPRLMRCEVCSWSPKAAS